jgi:hypothetical protein
MPNPSYLSEETIMNSLNSLGKSMTQMYDTNIFSVGKEVVNQDEVQLGYVVAYNGATYFIFLVFEENEVGCLRCTTDWHSIMKNGTVVATGLVNIGKAMDFIGIKKRAEV